MVDLKTVDAGLLQSRYRLTKQRAALPAYEKAWTSPISRRMSKVR